MIKSTLKAASISEQVADRIRDHIIDQSLCVGDSLPNELALVEQLGVSRSAVREATKSLGYLGIIEATPGKGLTVGRADLSKVIKVLEFLFAVSDFPRDQLIYTRMTVELGVLPHVSRRMQQDPTIYDRLYRLTDRPGIMDDVEIYREEDEAFHCTMIEASGIEPLMAFNEVIRIFFRVLRNEVAYTVEDLAPGVHSHRQLLNALRDGDVEQAIGITRIAFDQYLDTDTSEE